MIDLINFTGPSPPEWRIDTSVVYFKDKFYFLGGEDPKTRKGTNRVDVRRDRMKVVHEIVYSGANRWEMANRTYTSYSN